MKMSILAGFLLLGASAFAAGNIYKVEILQDSVIEGKAVKAGEYKLSFDNGNAVLKQGKQVVEVPARELTGTEKVPTNELTYEGDANLKSIELGGTTKRIVFENAGSAQSGM